MIRVYVPGWEMAQGIRMTARIHRFLSTNGWVSVSSLRIVFEKYPYISRYGGSRTVE